jgi:predicted RNA-binding protein YlqC (UPF0109 family)
MKELVEDLAKSLVDLPESVEVREIPGDPIVLELKVAPGDVGKVIGRQGRTARSIRSVLAAAGAKKNRRYALDILEAG